MEPLAVHDHLAPIGGPERERDVGVDRAAIRSRSAARPARGRAASSVHWPLGPGSPKPIRLGRSATGTRTAMATARAQARRRWPKPLRRRSRPAGVPRPAWPRRPRPARLRGPRPTLAADLAARRGRARRGVFDDRGRSPGRCSTSARRLYAAAAAAAPRRRDGYLSHCSARPGEVELSRVHICGLAARPGLHNAGDKSGAGFPSRAAIPRALPDPLEECMWTSSSCLASSSP